LKAEDRKRYLSRKRTYVLENIAPNEMHIVADIIVNQIKPSEVFPALFDILQSKEPGKIPKGTDDEIMLSYLVTETKTRRVIKQLTPKARKDFLKGLGHEFANLVRTPAFRARVVKQKKREAARSWCRQRS
jgi:hypothetical protein